MAEPLFPLSNAHEFASLPLVDARVPKFIADWWQDKTPEQIKSIADPSTKRILWPDLMKIRVEAGGIKEVPIYLVVPNPIDRLQAVIATNAKIAEMFKVDKSKLPLSREDAMRFAGDEWGFFHNAYLMSFCILEWAPVEGRADGMRRHAYLPQTIIQALGMTTILDLYNRLELYAALEDVRISEISPEIFHGFVANIARCMSLAPLFGCSGAVFDRLVVMMAEEIIRLRRLGEPSSESPSTSTPE